MKKRSKLFPYGYMSQHIKGYCVRTRQPVYEYNHNLPKQKTYFRFYFRVVMISLLLCGAMALIGCSTTPNDIIVDSRGKSSANVDGSADRFHDDFYTCKSLVEDNTNAILNSGKVLYNGFRWRVLWLSPKLSTRQDYINNCLTGRGYNVIDK